MLYYGSYIGYGFELFGIIYLNNYYKTICLKDSSTCWQGIQTHTYEGEIEVYGLLPGTDKIIPGFQAINNQGNSFSYSRTIFNNEQMSINPYRENESKFSISMNNKNLYNLDIGYDSTTKLKIENLFNTEYQGCTLYKLRFLPLWKEQLQSYPNTSPILIQYTIKNNNETIEYTSGVIQFDLSQITGDYELDLCFLKEDQAITIKDPTIIVEMKLISEENKNFTTLFFPGLEIHSNLVQKNISITLKTRLDGKNIIDSTNSVLSRFCTLTIWKAEKDNEIQPAWSNNNDFKDIVIEFSPDEKLELEYENNYSTIASFNYFYKIENILLEQTNDSRKKLPINIADGGIYYIDLITPSFVKTNKWKTGLPFVKTENGWKTGFPKILNQKGEN